MANAVITKYLSDTSIPREKREKIMEGLNSGQLSENAAVQGITMKYGTKYGAANTSGSDKTAGILKGVVGAFNPANLSSNLQKVAEAAPKVIKAANDSGLLSKTTPTDEQVAAREAFNSAKVDEMAKVSQQMNKMGAVPSADMSLEDRKKSIQEVEKAQPGITLATNVASDAEKGFSEGAGKIYKAGEKLGHVFTGVGPEGQQLSPEERGQKFGEALLDTAAGSLEGIFAAPGAVVGQVPGVRDVIGFGMEKLKEGSDAIANKYIESTGIDPNSEQAKYLREGMNTLSQLLVAKVTEDTGKEIGRRKGMEKASATGDVAAMEKLAAQKPTMTGTVGANVIQGVEAIAKPIIEGAKTVTENITTKIGEDLSENMRMNQTARIEKYKVQVDKTAAQIIQGKSKDLKAAKKALDSIDTSDVKSFTDLSQTMKEKVDILKATQDSMLERHGVTYKLSNFDKEIKAGNISIKINPVQDALTQLQELYSKTNAPEDLVRIQDLAKKAEKYSLTLKDVNDIAREYGTEFGRKAFSKTGDALTSVNAQAYENTRSAVKEAVRGEMKDNVARIMDKQMSDLISTKGNIDKLVEEANRLQQKIQERGIGEKIGRNIGKVINLVSLGSAKGLIEQFISRGSGLKTLNALDLQSMLKQNLNKFKKLNRLIDATEK